ncbi:MAG: succinate dehydrogenase [Rhodovarius sp.]|nr:succinate dehydrogenase [Rhodovarius sp.]MCX7932346.1 succinate dehydrogenase [Rhodovarius sp.]MDW8314967.1 succinate dehydrogenase [Rhodovarius sp.]
MIRPTRSHPAWIGFLVHRLSGLALALFLPVHFWALSRAIEGEAALDRFLAWTEDPLVKASEGVLVVLLAVHLAGGLRVMALEFLGWRARQKDLVAASFGFALAVGLLFALHVG